MDYKIEENLNCSGAPDSGECIDCNWSGLFRDAEIEYEWDSFTGMDVPYPICPKCGGGIDNYYVSEKATIEQSLQQWMRDWIKASTTTTFENSFNEISDEWVEIKGVGRFKNLKLLPSMDVKEDERRIVHTLTMQYEQFEQL